MTEQAKNLFGCSRQDTYVPKSGDGMRAIDAKGKGHYIPVFKRYTQALKRNIVDITKQAIQAKSFQAFHSTFNRIIVIDAQDLLSCLVAFVGGLLLIDPFGLSRSLLEAILWLLPTLITLECLGEAHLEGHRSESNIELSGSSYFQDPQAAKWMDFWICSIGFYVAVTLFDYAQFITDGVPVILGRTTPVVLVIQVAILGWWVVGNQIGPTDSMTVPMTLSNDAKLPETNVEVPGSKAKTSALAIQKHTDMTNPLTGSVRAFTPLGKIEETKASSTRSKPDLSLSRLSTPNEVQPKTAPTNEEAPRNRTEWQRKVHHIAHEDSFSSYSSTSSNEPLSDEHSSYSDSSFYASSDEESIPAEAPAKTLDLRMLPQVQPGSSRSYKETDQIVREPETSTSAPVKVVSCNAVAISNSRPSSFNPSRRAQTEATHNKSPLRASKIIAQLDSLLSDELDKLAMSTPIDTAIDIEAIHSAVSGKSCTSPLTPRVAALEHVRRSDEVEKKRSRQPGRKQVSTEDSVNRLEETPQPEEQDIVDAQLDDLLATRMSDLFSKSAKSSMSP